jgi:hypothetical protein
MEPITFCKEKGIRYKLYIILSSCSLNHFIHLDVSLRNNTTNTTRLKCCVAHSLAQYVNLDNELCNF